jgi:uncharacterized membrane protein YkvA (DUF1232 family)
MTSWEWALVGLGIVAALYGSLVIALLVAGRRGESVALARFIPDCIVLFGRLLRDHRVPRRSKIVLALLLGYLALPFDLVPDFVPVAGQLDDVLVVALALRVLLRAGGADLVREHWPGPGESLELVLRASGAARGRS